jgi:DNA-binding protein H-NS
VKKLSINAMNVRDLRDLKGRLAAAIDARKETEKDEVKAELSAIAQKRGFDLDELFGKQRKNGNGSKVALKYRNPVDSAQTWTGRGRTPLWIKAHADKGTKLDKFLIK